MRAFPFYLALCGMAWLVPGNLLPVQGEASNGAQGLWLLPRHDSGNSGRADIPAQMSTAPREIWHYGGEIGAYSFVRKLGSGDYLVQIGRGLERVAPDGKTRWSRRTLGVGVVVEVGDLNGDGREEVLASLGKKGFALISLADGQTLWEWSAPPGTYLVRYQLLHRSGGTRLIVFPPFSTLGFCFDFARTDETPKLLWQQDYAGKYTSGFGPSIVLADMDNDGKPEIVAASDRTRPTQSAYLAVIDSDTGEIRFDVSYDIEGGPGVGRPYGLLQAVDLDGDGYRDIVLMMSQVEEYIAVVHNEGGKALRPVWSRFFEKDFPTDFKEFRPTTTAVADTDGNGKPELVFGLYNATGDRRWHTLVLDPMVGLDVPRKDFVDRYCWGTADLDGDGIAEIITSPTRSRLVSDATTLEAVSGRTLRAVSTIKDARLVTRSVNLYMPARPLAADRVFYGALASPIIEGRGLVVRRRGRESVWNIAGGKSNFVPRRVTEEPPRGRAVAASAPLVGLANGRRELVLALSDGTIIGGVPDWRRPGRFASSWHVRGTMPALWLCPRGERVVCAIDPDADTLLLHRPGSWRRSVEIALPIPINRNLSFADAFPRASAWPVPFGKDALRVFVGLRPGEHALAGAVCDGSGKIVWVDPDCGPHPRTAAVADLDGDGANEIIVDNHGMQYFYGLDGRARMVAHVWGDTIPGRGDGCAHALPIVGPFGPDGALRIIMSPGYSSLETMDAAGSRIARRGLANMYEFANRVAAVGNPRGRGIWDMGIVSETGAFHCVDVATLATRWTLDVGGTTLWPVAVTAGDLTGDGHDEFLVGLPSGDLIAVMEQDGRGEILWRKQFSAGVIETILSDVDGDGQGEIIIHTDDGFVRVLAGRSAKDGHLSSVHDLEVRTKK